ncbi:choloylglycine hydrolase family protein [Chelatococcus sp. SYSU_G07232]|uniref:Choloylglycine hydrolase family protein n=2 Tax=Chelatococcus albus TaxID=3047466 RepID=A0ABT7AD10_9HYPH|nr:choloylglycine hydrolase family protein [Chelatococcus sp. SYSU_G07232]MDJ1157263.1 choloylglycine hydrolase family protein [Chelatococcus sp. SYSU_G07232]
MALAGAVAFAPSAEACTSFLLKAADGSPVYGRTMEYGIDLKSSVIIIPRGQPYVATGPAGGPGLKWSSKYAVVGMSAFGKPGVADGMNEKGLAGGNLYFPGFAGYADPAKADPARSIAGAEFLTWVLTSFATVAEVKAALAGVEVIDAPVAELGGIAPPFHFALHDASGASIVIEPIDGKLRVYDNPLGVLTNSPTFDWHMTNLRNYIKISPVNADPVSIEGLKLEPFGQGSGLLGIPGDPTPPSRFLRAIGYVISAKTLPTGAETVRLAEHILNNFDIPVGFIRGTPKEGGGLEYTQFSAIADLKARRYYIKTYDNQVLRSVDLMSFDLDAKTIRSAPLTPLATIPALAFQ